LIDRLDEDEVSKNIEVKAGAYGAPARLESGKAHYRGLADAINLHF